MVKRTVTRTTTTTTSGHAVVHKAVAVRKAPAHKTVAAKAKMVEHATAVAEPAPPRDQPVATVDRKIVIHKDKSGQVTRETRIERQEPDGSTTVVHHSEAEPPAPPSDDQ